MSFQETVAASLLEALFTAVFTAVLVVGVAGFFVRAYEDRLQRMAFDRQRNAEDLRQKTQIDYDTRTILRETYAELLKAQRRSRQASLALGKAGGEDSDPELASAAIAAHDEFIDAYHRLNLDATRPMWLGARALRAALDDLLEKAREGDSSECESLYVTARRARQNLEDEFRVYLTHERLHHAPYDLGKYDKNRG